MKIAYLVDRFPAISETFVLAQITGMIDKGHEVHVFARRGATTNVAHTRVDRYRLREMTTYSPLPPASVTARVRAALRIVGLAWKNGQIASVVRALKVFWFGWAALNLRLLISAAPYFDHPDIDVVHCQFGDLATEIWRLRQCGALKGALVTSFRGTDAMKVAAKNPRRFARLFSDGEKFLAVSYAVRDKLIQVGCPEPKIEVLRSGINLERFQFRGYRPVNDPLRVISVGRLAPNKGIEFCIRAIAALRESGVGVEYRILGGGPLRKTLEALVGDLGLEDIVVFEGPTTSDTVIDAIGAADVLVTPSITGPNGEQEGLPNAPKEAMAIAVPVIASSIGGIPELVKAGETGFLVSEKDPASIASAISSIQVASDDLEAIITAARALIDREFDIVMLNDRLEATYRDLVVA